jgi:hypothetical protein
VLIRGLKNKNPIAFCASAVNNIIYQFSNFRKAYYKIE